MAVEYTGIDRNLHNITLFLLLLQFHITFNSLLDIEGTLLVTHFMKAHDRNIKKQGSVCAHIIKIM